MLVSVPKKRFKRAVKRNRVKRLVREAYRLNKHELDAQLIGLNINIAFVFLESELPTQKTITRAVLAALQRISTDIERKKNESCTD